MEIHEGIQSINYSPNRTTVSFNNEWAQSRECPILCLKNPWRGAMGFDGIKYLYSGYILPP
jgi:hypothetical protein